MKDANYKSTKQAKYYIKVVPNILFKEELDFSAYINNSDEILNIINKTFRWGDVFDFLIHRNEPTSQEAFIDIVERRYKIKIKNATRLLIITGYLFHRDRKEYSTLFRKWIISNRETKLFDIVCNALKNGANYNDILKYKLADYGLPDSWTNCWGNNMNKKELLRTAIYYSLNLGKQSFTEKELKAIAGKIEAPYDVILDAKNLYSRDINDLKTVKLV